MRALRGRYSGLCQPTYVLDIRVAPQVPSDPLLSPAVEQSSYEVVDPAVGGQLYAASSKIRIKII